MARHFPPPWTVEQIPGGFKVLDASGQSLAYVYGRETKADADIAKVLTMDEARRIASNIALPQLTEAALKGAMLGLMKGAIHEHRATAQSWLPSVRTFLGVDHSCDRRLDNDALTRMDRAISGKVEL